MRSGMSSSLVNYFVIFNTVIITFYGVFATLAPAQLVQPKLKVTLYKVTWTGANIMWHAFVASEQSSVYSAANVQSCELIYGPVNIPDSEIQVIPDVIPEGPLVTISHLIPNTSYHFQMVCDDFASIKLISNTIVFTTKSAMMDSFESFYRIQIPSSPQLAGSVVMGHMDQQPYSVYLKAERTPSSSVILGAICGIVGFLIINVTVVMVVRKYSHWQMRRRRMFELQNGEYDGLAYM